MSGLYSINTEDLPASGLVSTAQLLRKPKQKFCLLAVSVLRLKGGRHLLALGLLGANLSH
jgi:hypothetical protein